DPLTCTWQGGCSTVDAVRLVIYVGLMLTGCMYWDPINLKPKLSQVDCEIAGAPGRSCASVHRGDLLRLSVDVRDDGNLDNLGFDWRAFRCSDEGAFECEPDAYSEQTATTGEIEVPTDPSGVRAISVDLQVRDERGALAEQAPVYAINDAPTLAVQRSA